MQNQPTLSELSQRIQYIESKMLSPTSPDVLKLTDLDMSSSKKSANKGKSKLSEIEEYCQNLLQENERLNKICRMKDNENKVLQEKMEGKMSAQKTNENNVSPSSTNYKVYEEKISLERKINELLSQTSYMTQTIFEKNEEIRNLKEDILNLKGKKDNREYLKNLENDFYSKLEFKDNELRKRDIELKDLLRQKAEIAKRNEQLEQDMERLKNHLIEIETENKKKMERLKTNERCNELEINNNSNVDYDQLVDSYLLMKLENERLHEILSEQKNIQRDVAYNRANGETPKNFEKLIKEKDTEIQGLYKYISDLEYKINAKHANDGNYWNPYYNDRKDFYRSNFPNQLRNEFYQY